MANNDNPWDALTETQKRRIDYRVRGLTYRQIATIEKCCIKSIWESVTAACKKLSGLRPFLYTYQKRN